MYKLMATQELSAKFSVMSVKNEKLNKTSDGEKVCSNMDIWKLAKFLSARLTNKTKTVYRQL